MPRVQECQNSDILKHKNKNVRDNGGRGCMSEKLADIINMKDLSQFEMENS